MTQLTYDLARALAQELGARATRWWSTRLDHDANIRPVGDRPRRPSARRCAGSTSTRRPRELPFDPSRAVVERTRLVAVTGASNLLGTRPDLPAVADAVHEAGALLFVDGVHLTPHAPVDVARPRRRLLRLLAVQVLRPAPRRARRATRRCSRPCTRTSCCPRPTRCRSGSSSARCPTSCSPASPRRSTSSPTWLRGAAEPPRPGAGVDAAPSRRTRSGCSSGCSPASTRIHGVRRYGRPARRTPTVLFYVEGRTGARGARAPGRPRRQRAGQQLLRDRGVPVDRASATPARCGPGSRRTPRTTTSTGCSPASPSWPDEPGASWSPGRRAGIGAAVARAFAEQGDRVAVHYGGSRRRGRRGAGRAARRGPPAGAGRPHRPRRRTSVPSTRRPPGSAASTCWSTTPASSWRTRR